MASATTAQLLFRSACKAVSFKINLRKPLSVDFIAINVCANGTPIFRNTVESVRSRCKREIGNFAAKCSNSAFAIPKFPSAFSKSIGFTLCGIAEDPI
ncbi:hypothetical protein D3C71_1862360 [compost metagenome]